MAILVRVYELRRTKIGLDLPQKMARRIDEVMGSVVSFEKKSQDGKNWLQESLKSSTAANRRKGYNKFLCCFINNGVKEEDQEMAAEGDGETEGEPKQFQCYPKAKQKVVNSKVQDALKCVSDLIYEIILDS